MTKVARTKASEAELCKKFIEWSQNQGWTAYAETGGWDIVLVKDGIQVGIEAKRYFNATLLRQALPQRFGRVEIGPDYRAILLPAHASDVREVCDFCGLVFFWPGLTRRVRREGDGPFDADFCPELNVDRWPWWPAKERIPLPDYIPDVRAGASAPIQLTDWKIKALRICARLEVRGYVVRKDFQQVGIDHRRWVPMKWLRIDDDGRYVRGDKMNFEKQHPEVYSQILAEWKAVVADVGDTVEGETA